MKALVVTHGRAFVTVLVILALTASFAPDAHAQAVANPDMTTSADALPRFSYGVRANFSVTSFSGDAADSPDSEGRPGAGLFATYRLAPFMALQPELMYTRRSGGMQRIKMDTPTASVDIDLHYLELPVLFKFFLPEQQNTAPILLAGPYVSRRIDGTIQDANGVFDEYELDDLIRPVDYGVVLGAGLERFVGKRHLSFDARYSIGLTRLFDTDEEPDLYNQGLTFSVGLGL